MKINVLTYVILLFAYIFFVQTAKAENIHFNNDIYQLKSSRYEESHNGYANEYYPSNENKNNWKKMIGIYYYPEIKDPIKFAKDADKEIEAREGVVLLKYIENKKQNKAVISFLEMGDINGKKYFEHNIYKYEPNPTKGMMVLRYAKKYFFITDNEITEIGHEVRDITDDLIEQIIISPIPEILEEDIL